MCNEARPNLSQLLSVWYFMWALKHAKQVSWIGIMVFWNRKEGLWLYHMFKLLILVGCCFTIWINQRRDFIFFDEISGFCFLVWILLHPVPTNPVEKYSSFMTYSFTCWCGKSPDADKKLWFSAFQWQSMPWKCNFILKFLQLCLNMQKFSQVICFLKQWDVRYRFI